jgi:Ras-related protein Rab-5C
MAQSISPKMPTYKIALLGYAGVGKSSIVLRFVNDHWHKDISSTIGASFHTSKINVNNQIIKLEIWDTAGQERYNSLAPMYYRSSKVIIVVFDINDELSYKQAKIWINNVSNFYANEKTEQRIFLVANKIDEYTKVNQTCLIKHQVAAQYAKENNYFYTEVSAKSGSGVMELFHDIANYLSEENKPIQIPKKTVSVTDLVTYKGPTGVSNSCC